MRDSESLDAIAQASLAERADTPARAEPRGKGFGIGTRAQALPVQCRRRVRDVVLAPE
jgi:hypothetical protein